MYIWVGCDINSPFFKYREKVKELNAELGLSDTAINLPQHISLKITFEMDDALAKHCIHDIVDYLKTVKPFTVKFEQLELVDGILWIRTEQCDELKALHAELDEIGISYAVKPHELDKRYIFHTTVAMDEDAQKLNEMFEKIKDQPYPEQVKINTFLVGHSTDYVNFKIDRRIKVK